MERTLDPKDHRKNMKWHKYMSAPSSSATMPRMSQPLCGLVLGPTAKQAFRSIRPTHKLSEVLLALCLRTPLTGAFGRLIAEVFARAK